jgi:acetyl-CoA synthetase
MQIEHAESTCTPVSVDSEHPLFLLYTSGSTGKPKGLMHTTAGYLLHTMVAQKACFDVREGDVFGCAADIGWLVG